MVRIIDGENEFEIVGYAAPEVGEWYLTATVVTQMASGQELGFRHILRPIAGPAARPERRVDAETRMYFRGLEVPGMREILREAYRCGQRMRKGRGPLSPASTPSAQELAGTGTGPHADVLRI